MSYTEHSRRGNDMQMLDGAAADAAAIGNERLMKRYTCTERRPADHSRSQIQRRRILS